jgi:putative toxin-antitoxin system antitoxin component (TIGR02293 family)
MDAEVTDLSREMVIEKAVEVFGTREDALVWLDLPAMALGQTTPASLLGSEAGRQTVSNLLLQLEFGVYI